MLSLESRRRAVSASLATNGTSCNEMKSGVAPRNDPTALVVYACLWPRGVHSHTKFSSQNFPWAIADAPLFTFQIFQ